MMDERDITERLEEYAGDWTLRASDAVVVMEAMATIKDLRAALEQARGWFVEEGSGHHVNGDEVKAKRDFDRADFCLSACRRLPEITNSLREQRQEGAQ